MLDGGVLVLNSLYQAIQVTGVRRAFRLFYAGRAHAVAADFRTYAFEHWCDLPPHDGHGTIRTPTHTIPIPRIIQLLRYDRVPRRDVRFTRRNIFYRDRNRCQYCGKVFSQKHLNLDHVRPLSRGGGSGWKNVVCACVQCNCTKGNRTPEEAGMSLIRKPRKPSAHPALGSSWGQRGYKEWSEFLQGAAWSIELCDEVIAPPPADEQTPGG
jgi:5-methylcytosine-specific restriction endonuclease McrA